jgi:hypothetical protein
MVVIVVRVFFKLVRRKRITKQINVAMKGRAFFYKKEFVRPTLTP